MKRWLTSVALLASLLAPPAAIADVYDPPRSAFGNAGKVRGPISDFWFKVRSEWSGYLKPDPTPPPGGGPLNQRTFLTAPPNRVWVSLVYGDLAPGGEPGPLAHLFKEFLSEWKVAEGRNWPYAQIYDRTWNKMSQLGRTKNIIMIGTPWTLEPVGPLAESLGFEISPGRIDVGKRKYRGDNLVLIFIAPNPLEPDNYALVITGSGDEALLQAGHLPYGDTDYAIFRGRRLLESGFFGKDDLRAWRSPESYEAHGSRLGFSIRESAHYTFWYEPERMTREEINNLVLEKEAAYDSLIDLVPPSRANRERITFYLYPSVDRKIDETARDDLVHVDFATSEVHTVFSGSQQIVEPYLDLMVLLHRSIGPTRVPALERALAIALASEFQGRPLEELAARAFLEARRQESAVLRSLRDQNVMTPADGPPSSHDILLAGFMKDLVDRHGRQDALEWVSRASPRDLGESFHDVYGERLGNELEHWAERLERKGLTRTATRSTGRDEPSDGLEAASSRTAEVDEALRLLELRRDDEAIGILEGPAGGAPAGARARAILARLYFRNGRFDEAETQARAAIEACPGAEGDLEGVCAEAAAWSRLTLGRVEAVRGRYVAAHVELTHPDLVRGPEPVPTLADYWLLTMGQSRNQLTVVSHLKREARVLLRQLDWRAAEAELKKALEIDPTDGEAHRLLSEVYHKQHEYWAWQIRYLNEVHPDYNVIGRTFTSDADAPVSVRVESLHSLDSFNDLVLKGNVELLKAQTLYAVEIQNLHTEGDRLLIEKREVHEALALYERALELNPDFFLSHFLVGRCHFLLGHYDEAVKSFRETIRLKPTDALVLAWTHTYLGYISLESDELETAERHFRSALSRIDAGKVGMLARDGLGKVDTIRLLIPKGASR